MRRYYKNFPLLAMLIVSLLLASCGQADRLPQVELAPATLNWVTWEFNNKAESDLIRQFQEEYPQIDFQRATSYDSLEASVSQEPQPDLLNVDVGWDLSQVAANGTVADLTELWNASGLTENVPAALQEVSAFQDRQFYIPVGVGWKAIYYNKQIFADYNLSPPETWEEFLAICDTLLANGEVPLSISGSDAWAIHGWFEYLNLRLNGAQFYRDLLVGKERYDDPRVRNVMETWQQLFTNQYFIADPMMVSEYASVEGIVRSASIELESPQAVMVLASTYASGNLPAAFQGEIDFFRFPVMDSSIPVAEVVEPLGYVVPTDSEHLPETLAFLAYVSSSPAQHLTAQLPLFLSTHYAPVRSDIDREVLTAAQCSAWTLINEADEMALYYEYGVPSQMLDSVGTYFRRFVRTPEDIEFFLSGMEETRQKMIDQGVFLIE